jgi:hypothetical protein
VDRAGIEATSGLLEGGLYSLLMREGQDCQLYQACGHGPHAVAGVCAEPPDVLRRHKLPAKDCEAVVTATAAKTVAGMLEQLDVRPVHRVLEIGAGTGINVALLAHLAGPDGRATTIDVPPTRPCPTLRAG